MILAANWQMNPPLAEAGALAAAYAGATFNGVTRVLFPPAPYLVQMAMRLDGSGILLGGQDCHQAVSGAHTGDVSAAMLASCGAGMVLIGHSERREAHGESDGLVAAKAGTALAEGLSVMICVGETLDQREAGDAEAVVTAQLDGSVPDGISADRLMLAYEPVWAIGTGETASIDHINEIHEQVKSKLKELDLNIPVLYGGSVNPSNSKDILISEFVDGVLVGGASTKIDQIVGILNSI